MMLANKWRKRGESCQFISEFLEIEEKKLHHLSGKIEIFRRKRYKIYYLLKGKVLVVLF